jgi:hypothetical protein
MKKTLLLSVLALTMTATIAHAHLVLIGYAVPGVPSSDANELAFVTTLIAMDPGDANQDCDEPTGGNVNTCIRPFGSYDQPVFPAPVIFDRIQAADFPAPVNGEVLVDLNGGAINYVIAKYGGGQTDGGSAIYYNFEAQLSDTIPLLDPNAGNGSLSHISRLGGAGVPDGGVTLILLGGALVGLETMRRKFGV